MPSRKKARQPLHPPLPRLERPISLTAQVEQILRRAIAENCFPSGKLPTEVELAEQLGVSRETVRLACEKLQREGLVHKVRRRGTFLQPPALPSPLRPRQARVLMYLQADYARSPWGEDGVVQTISGLMLQGALRQAADAGCMLLVRQVSVSAMRETLNDLLRFMTPLGIVFASYGEEKVVKSALGLGVPVVLLDHDLPSVRVHSVRDDSFRAATDAVRLLAEYGHRRIAFVNWQRAELNPWRLRGYREGLRQLGLPRRREWEIAVPLNRRGAEQAVSYLLGLHPRPTAIYCFNNTLARYVWEELRSRQVAVPEEVSLVGGGGEPVPDLCCHQADWEAMGQLAVQVLLRYIPLTDSSPAGAINCTPANPKDRPPEGAPNDTKRRGNALSAEGPNALRLEHHVCPHQFFAGRTIARPGRQELP
ncbi:MAG: GntR family transcriptional regulator [Gemmatales bacterium]|nr:GntR family transcriptional regulator [Gemmatales bacterium]